ncbi:MAG: autotransporter domain-containing protein, partial [Pseudomonadota bacterium]
AIAISASKTLTTGSNNLDTTTTTLASGSALTLSSGTVTGTVQGLSDGVGTVSFTQDFTAAGNFGTSSNSLSSIAISASRTLTTGSNNLDATTITLGSGSTLTLSSGTVTGAVQGTSDGVGTISFTQDFTAAGNFGSSSNSLSAIAISASKTLTTGSNNLDATTITLGSGSTLTLSSGTVTGAVQGTSDGVGTISFTQDFTAAGNFGSSSNSLSAIAISASKTLTTGSNNLDATTITLGSGSTLTLSSGTVTGAVQGTSDGVGTISFTQDFTAAGNFGSSSNSLSAIAISANKTLSVGSYNLDATTTTLASGSVLTLGSGTVTGAVQGISDGVGTISFTQDFTAAGNFGTSSNSLSAISVASGKTVNFGDNNLDATTVSLNSSAALSFGSGTISGTIQGVSDGIGTINFNADRTLSQDFGTSGNSFAAITIAAGKTLSSGSYNLDATLITLNSGSTLTLANGSVNGVIQGSGTVSLTDDFTANNNFGTSGNSLSAIVIAAGKTFNLGNNNINSAAITLNSASALSVGTGEIIAPINGSASGVGILNISGINNINSSNPIGQSNALAAVNIADNTTVTVSNSVSATNLTIGDGAELIYSGGTITGQIRGLATNQGTLEIASDMTSSAIGTDAALSALNINSGKTLTVGGNISANNILVTGTFDLGNSSRVITGNIAGSGAGFINAGNASHTISGDLNLNSGDSLALAISSVTSAGKLIVDGAITNSSGTNLEVTIPTTTYIPSGTSYVILEGSSGSSINAISNIDINNSGNSKVGNLLFSTSVSDDDLLLTISRSTPSLTQKNMQTIYDNIAALGSSSSGELRNFQTYLDFLNDSEMSSALASATAQIDNSVNRNSVNSATLSVLTTEGRMKMDYASASPEIAVERMKMAYAANGLSQNQQLNNGVWVQGFTAYAHQDNEEFLDGYKLNELGTAIGYDHKTSKNSRLGAALSYGNSSIKSVTSLKKVTVDSYQANIYGSYNFDKIFFNAIGGFAWNNYNSKRAIPAISETAQADYQGQTYVGKIKSGYVYNFGKGFRMIPEAMVTYVHNHTEGYEESGAGTMNLKIASQNSDFLEGRVGLNFDYWYSTSRDTKINPELRFSYGYDFLHDNQAVTSSFVGQSSVFVTQAPDVDPKSFKAGFGINLFKANSMTFTADYNLELKSNYVGHYGFLRARYNF